MGSRLKIAVIGGGSSYTPEIVEGFIKHYEQMPVGELWLVDIEQGREKLEIVGNLARRMVQAAGLPIQVVQTTDRRTAIAGAEFVIAQLRVGLLLARSWDERIPLQYGVIGQETTGPGGMMKALRTIPVILDICRDMEELAPDAWLLNFTNPAGMVTEAVHKYARVRAIGLCNAPIGFQKQISRLYNVPLRHVLPEFVGLNHLHWVTSLVVQGKERLAELLHEEASAGTLLHVPALGWAADYIRAIGAIPSAYLRYYYMQDEMLGDQLEALERGETRADTVMRLERELFEIYKDPKLKEKPVQLEQRGGAYYSEAAVQLMYSLFSDQRDIQTLNVSNGRIFEFLPPDAVIEVNCVVTAKGPIPLPVSHVPRAVRGLMHEVKTYESLTIDAAVQGDRELALQAIVAHPLVHSKAVGQKLLDELLDRNRPYLSRFYPEG